MFPPKTVGIIGINGKMARSIYVPLFNQTGFQVIGSDKNDTSGLTNSEVVAKADVVLFSVLPLSEVATVMQSQIANARANTLWLHGSSVQEVRDNSISEVLISGGLKRRGVDTGFIHFMIAPTVRSIRGQSIVFGFPNQLNNPEWRTWLLDLLQSKKAKLSEKTVLQHDNLTKAAQLLPMILSVAVGMIWQRSGIDVAEMLRVAGAPAKLQAFGTLRSLGQQDVVAEIITEHPAGPALIETLAEVFKDLSEMINAKDATAIAVEMRNARERVDTETLAKVLTNTDWLVRLLGDLNGGAVGFEFEKSNNQIGLLNQVLACFDQNGIDKTTTTAQTTPDGKAQFLIGVEPEIDDPKVIAASNEVLSLPGADILLDRFSF